MNLNERHLYERNREGWIMSMSIMASMVLVTLMAFVNGVRTDQIVRLVVLVIGMIVSTLGWKVNYHLVTYTTFIAFLVTAFTYRETCVIMYLFPIAVMLMVYQNQRLVLISAFAAILAAGVFFYVLDRRFPDEVESSQVVVQMLVVVVAAIDAYFVVKVQYRQQEQARERIEAQAAEQAKTAVSVVDHAKELATEFQQAMQVSETLNECMGSSHSSISEIAESTRLTAEAIEQQTARTADIQQSIRRVEDEAQQMSARSGATQEAVAEGVELIRQLREQAAEVARISHETEQTTKNLNASIREVEAITETILGISSQTNLLALNASIEAARAGEAGKGFAVVADEIRNLSEDTKQATEQISQIIARLTKDAQEAADSMSRSAAYAEKQNEMIAVTGDKLTDIQHNSDALNGNVTHVTVAVDEVVAANSAISDSIANLSATSQQVAASTESSLSLSDSSMGALAQMNDLLNGIYAISEDMAKLSQE